MSLNTRLLVIGEDEFVLEATGDMQWLEITVRDGYEQASHWLNNKNAVKLRDALTTYLKEQGVEK